MNKTLHTILNIALISVCAALVALGTAPRLGSADIPELPMADGSGETPEMVIDLVPKGTAATAGRLKLSSLRGRVVLLDMFRSTCPHCLDHAPHIVEMYNQYRRRGFTVLGLATDDKTDKAAVKGLKEFLAKTGINYPVGYISVEAVAYYADSRNHGVPQMVLFGSDGKMTLRKIGWSEAYGKEFRQAIEAQLARIPVASPDKKPLNNSGVRKAPPQSRKG